MPNRTVIAKELAEIFKVIAHPDRIRLIEVMRSGEMDVNSLAESLELPGARVSQHLSLLRAHRLVEERRDGRRHYYHLSQPEIASWIVAGIDFIEGRLVAIPRESIDDAKRLWSADDDAAPPNATSKRKAANTK